MLPMRTNSHGSTDRIAGLTTASSPLAMIDEMRREMDRVFDRMLGTWNEPLPPSLATARLGGATDVWLPSMDVRETDKELQLTVEVPGLDADDLHVDVTDDVLTISGEKKVERDETEGAYRLVERRSGRFERRVMLPSDVDAEHVAAEYDHGVLTVTIPKRADAKRARRVEIRGGTFQKLLGRAKKDAAPHRERAGSAHGSNGGGDRKHD